MERIFGPFKMDTDFSDKEQSIRAELERDDISFYRFVGGNPSKTEELRNTLESLRERKPLIVGIYRFPFQFEGKRKRMAAREQYFIMKDYCDAVITFESDGLMESIDPSTPIHDAPKSFDMLEEKVIQGLRDTLDETGIINIDYHDIKTFIQQKRGPLFLHTIEGKTFDEPLRNLLTAPYLPEDFTEGEQLMINIGYSRDVDMQAFRQINLRLNDLFDKADLFKLGSYFIDEPGQRFKITMIVNGLQDPIETPKTNNPSPKTKSFIKKWKK